LATNLARHQPAVNRAIVKAVVEDLDHDGPLSPSVLDPVAAAARALLASADHVARSVMFAISKR